MGRFLASIGSKPRAPALVFLAANHGAGSQRGTEDVAALGILNTIAMLLVFPPLGVMRAMQPLIGHNKGAGKDDRVRAILVRVLAASLAMGVLFSVAAVAGARAIAVLFSKSDPTLVKLYGNAQISIVDAVRALLPSPLAFLFEGSIAENLGLPTPITAANLTDSLGLDPTRPIVFALHPGGRSGEARGIVEQVRRKGASREAVREALRAIHAFDWPVLGSLRVVIPLHQPNKPKLLALLRRMSDSSLRECVESSPCDGFGSERPVLYSSKIAVYLSDDALRIDMVNRTDETESPKWLAWLNTQKGGPSPRCQRLSEGALMAFCASAPEVAALGHNTGVVKVLSVLDSDGFDDDQRASLLEQGLMEVGRIATLSEPLHPSLSDGTFSLEQDQGMLVLAASWKVEPTIAFDDSCHVSLAEAASTLLPRLRETLSSGTPRFTDLDELRQYIAEAGWASYPILAAGQWPLILSHLNPDSVVEPFGLSQMCSGLSEGRLYIRWNFEPVEPTESSLRYRRPGDVPAQPLHLPAILAIELRAGFLTLSARAS